MFERLQKKWKVNGLQLLLILCTFAIGGSLTGYAGRRLMNLFNIDQNWLWIIVYILLVTLLWPMAVLLVSIPFGQFRFFTGYLKKMGRRMRIISQQSTVGNQQSAASDTRHPAPGTRIAIFASGAGSNAQKIIDYFRNSSTVKVSLIVCNKPGAGILQIAARENIPVLMIEKETFFRGHSYITELKKHRIDFIVLAGFLWKVPVDLIKAWSGRIINIHPALLPAYGGKGMYGAKVHASVIEAGDRESGISIHYVDDQYDHGKTIFQARCEVRPGDTAESLAQRVHQLEHEHYPQVIERLIAEKFSR